MKILIIFQIIILVLTCPNLVFAQDIGVHAKAYILMEAKTGQVIISKNQDVPLPPASTTKILTAIMAIERGEVDKEIVVSNEAASVGEASIHLEPGEKISVLNLLKGALIKSGNDASFALAEYVGGTEDIFLLLMNRKAKLVGALNSTFYNANGLPHKGHLSTAKDLALMARYGLNNRLFKSIVATKEERIPWSNYGWDRNLVNTNKLLWKYTGADGVKTGTTKEAGSCLVASATKGDRQLIAVVLKSGDRFGEAARLLDYGFNKTSLRRIPKGSEYGALLLPGSDKRIPLVVPDDYEFTTLNSSKLKYRIVTIGKRKNLVQQGDYIGVLVVEDSSGIVARIPLVASKSSKS